MPQKGAGSIYKDAFRLLVSSACKDYGCWAERDIDSAACFEESLLSGKTFFVQLLEITQIVAQVPECESDSRFHGAQWQIQMLSDFAMG